LQLAVKHDVSAFYVLVSLTYKIDPGRFHTPWRWSFPREQTFKGMSVPSHRAVEGIYTRWQTCSDRAYERSSGGKCSWVLVSTHFVACRKQIMTCYFGQISGRELWRSELECFHSRLFYSREPWWPTRCRSGRIQIFLHFFYSKGFVI
jgi:hypothetical protein